MKWYYLSRKLLGSVEIAISLPLEQLGEGACARGRHLIDRRNIVKNPVNVEENVGLIVRFRARLNANTLSSMKFYVLGEKFSLTLFCSWYYLWHARKQMTKTFTNRICSPANSRAEGPK
jgi:hypothetical protein